LFLFFESLTSTIEALVNKTLLIYINGVMTKEVYIIKSKKMKIEKKNIVGWRLLRWRMMSSQMAPCKGKNESRVDWIFILKCMVEWTIFFKKVEPGKKFPIRCSYLNQSKLKS